MKLKIYFISSLWLNLFEYIVRYVYVILPLTIYSPIKKAQYIRAKV